MKHLKLPVSRAVFVLKREAKALLATAAVAYGCWLIYHPAGFIAAGVLLLADRITD